MFNSRTTPHTVAILLVLLFCSTTAVFAQQGNYYSGNGNGASYQEFYDELSPYGEWMNDPEYGYVWVPDAGSDFRPYYSNGYWANTEFGNTWVSDYDWGWAPFHYGRWTYNNYYGWVWIPGNTWGPAWVSWRSGGGCYGWAPLGPGISVNVSFGSSYYVPDYWWTFTPQQYILSPRFHNYSYGPRNNNTYIHQTTIINNTYVYNHNTYITGPRRQELERATGRPVQQVAINNENRPGRGQLRGNSLNLYRPAISEATPRSSERPRQFRTVEQPIGRGNAVSPANPGPDRSISQGARPERGGLARPDAQRNPSAVDRGAVIPTPDRNNGIDRRPDRSNVEAQHPQRTEQVMPQRDDRAQLKLQQQQQLQEQRMADQRAQQAQQQQIQQSRIREQQVDQQMQMERQRAQQAQMQQRAQQAEQMRAQQAQVQQQQRMVEQQRAAQQAPRIERQQPQPMQRTELPRPAPQQRESAPAPMQGEGRPGRR